MYDKEHTPLEMISVGLKSMNDVILLEPGTQGLRLVEVEVASL
jgi:hypothetical protein